MRLNEHILIKDTLITLNNNDSIKLNMLQYNAIIKVENTPLPKTQMDYFILWFPAALAAFVALIGIFVAYNNIKRQVRYNSRQQWINDFRLELINFNSLFEQLSSISRHHMKGENQEPALTGYGTLWHNITNASVKISLFLNDNNRLHKLFLDQMNQTLKLPVWFGTEEASKNMQELLWFGKLIIDFEQSKL